MPSSIRKKLTKIDNGSIKCGKRDNYVDSLPHSYCNSEIVYSSLSRIGISASSFSILQILNTALGIRHPRVQSRAHSLVHSSEHSVCLSISRVRLL